MRGFRSWEKKWWNACTSARIQRRLELVPWRKNTEKKITKFGVFQQKIYCSKTKESWINKTQDHSDHRLCQGMLAILYPEVDEGERRILSRIIWNRKSAELVFIVSSAHISCCCAFKHCIPAIESSPHAKNKCSIAHSIINRFVFHLRCQFQVQPTTQQFNISVTTAL